MVEDTQTDSRLAEVARRRGFRSTLMVPMICKGRAIGTIQVARQNPGLFYGKEIKLPKTCADQPVGAIEISRLFEADQTSSPAVTWGVNVPANNKLVVAAYGDGTIRWYRLTDGQELLAL